MSENNESTETTVEEVIEPTEEENDAALLDVISEAIDAETDPEALAASKPEETAEEIAARETEEAAAATKEAEEAAAAEAAKTPEEIAADEAAATKEAEDAAAAAEAAKTPEEKAADAAAAEEAEVDPINDPIPEATNEKTAARIKSLIDIAKENTTRGDNGDEIVERITATGTDANQYANTLGFLSMYNSTDPDMRKKALAVARGVVSELSIELGEGSADLIAGHDDLVAGMEAGTIDEKSAIEIATGRAKKALDTSRTTAVNDQQTATDEINALITAGKEQLVTFETNIKADPDWARLRPIFVATLRPAVRNVPGDEWGATAAEIYKAVKAANPAPPPVVDPTPKPTPLRTKGSGGGGSSTKEGEPDSALAAMNAQLADM